MQTNDSGTFQRSARRPDAPPADQPELPEEYDPAPQQPGPLGQPLLLVGETNAAITNDVLHLLYAAGYEVSIEYPGEYQRVYTIDPESHQNNE